MNDTDIHLYDAGLSYMLQHWCHTCCNTVVQVHYTWPNGRGSLLMGVEPTRPTYARLVEMLKSVPNTRASRSWVDRVLDINNLKGGLPICSFHVSVYLSACLSGCLSVCPLVCLSVISACGCVCKMSNACDRACSTTVGFGQLAVTG